MDSEEEDDSNSLLSLSQSFLQSDGSPVIALSNNTSWGTSVAGSGIDSVNQFSPVSPAAHNYNSQASEDNDENFQRFYSFRPAISNHHCGKIVPFTRGDSTMTQVDAGFSPSSRLNPDGTIHAENASGDLYFDQSLSSRSSQSYCSKNADNVFRQGDHSSYAEAISHSQGGVDLSKVAHFSHPEGYSNIINKLLTSDTDDKLEIFDNRVRHSEFVKEMDNIYEHSVTKSGNKATLGSDDLTSLDRRQLEAANFDSDFDVFPSNQRDFTTSKLDGTVVGHFGHLVTFHHQQDGYENLGQGGKHSSFNPYDDGVSPLLAHSVNDESNHKRSSCAAEFSGVNENDYGRVTTSSQKKNCYAQLGDLPSDLEPVFHSDLSAHLNPSTESQYVNMDMSNQLHASKPLGRSTEESRSYANKWSGRSRPHRKMARLLGTDVRESFHFQGSESLEKTYSNMHSSASSTFDKAYQPIPTNDLDASGRTFLTINEELNLRTSQQQERQLRRDEMMRHQILSRELGLLQSSTNFSLDSSTALPSKDANQNLLANQHYLMQSQMQPHLDLDLNVSLASSQPSRDTDLNQQFGLQAVSKTFEADSEQDMMSLDQSNLQHIGQQDLSLPDNLSFVPPGSQDLNLEAYFMTPTDREVSFGRKVIPQTHRDNTEADFSIEELMNNKDLGQPYFDRADLPQDMSIYQKPEKQAMPSDEHLLSRDRTRGNHVGLDKQNEISELQKELTKTSTKESTRGVRIPRDINRALEIFEGLQQHEKEEEERRKEQQQQQLRSQQFPAMTVGASPKKTFQNKHLVEQMGMQPCLGQPPQYMEDQSVISLLDQSSLGALQEGQLMYQQKPFKSTHPSRIVEMPPLTQKDTVIDGINRHTNKLTHLGKDLNSCQNSNMFIHQHSNLASLLTDNVVPELPFTNTMSQHFPNQMDVMEQRLLTHSKQAGGGKHVKIVNHNNNMNNGDVQGLDDATPIPEIVTHELPLQEDILMSSRLSLYVMMTREEFCDAVLSTPQQTVKLHQVVLCSMSHYLSSLLLNMKPDTEQESASKSPSSSYFSQTMSNQGVLLLVSSQEIKPSSISAFLLFIYLGAVEVSKSNVHDLYMLACSLKVTSLEDQCKQFMFSAQLPSDHIKIPQLRVFSRRPEQQELLGSFEAALGKTFEDKCVSTAPCVVRMEASTQTDRSTTHVGKGGQEEWVMLKKTKQKTVSPSKLHNLKSHATSENQTGSKVCKKSCLSPKNVKTDIQAEGRVDSLNDLISESGQMNFSIVSEGQRSPVTPGISVQSQVIPLVSMNPNNSLAIRDCEDPAKTQLSDILPAPVDFDRKPCSARNLRTTVEIAAAAATAKLSAHTYGTRLAKGHAKTLVSYATLASVGEKKKQLQGQKLPQSTTIPKKKDFVNSSPLVKYLANDDPQVNFGNTSVLPHVSYGETLISDKSTNNPVVSKHLVKRPFKKSMVHRTQREEVLRTLHESEENSEELPILNTGNTSCVGDYIVNSVSHVSTLIDSIIDTMGSDNVDVDIQKVFSDLDSELNKSPLLTSTTSGLSASLTSPLKSPQAMQPTSESPLHIRLKSTPQGFRKRLIQMMNSESGAQLQEGIVPAAPAAISSTILCETQEVLGTAGMPEKLCKPSTTSQHQDSSLMPSMSGTAQGVKPQVPLKNSQLPSSDHSAVNDLPQCKILDDVLEVNEMEAGQACCDPLPLNVPLPADLKLLDGQHTDILKRKKKSKSRKLSTEADGNAVKVKKCAEVENVLLKPRQRKAAGSDSDGSSGGRLKLKKLYNEKPESQAKVRPPPKKRAKMELELMKAAVLGAVEKDSLAGQNSCIGPVATEARCSDNEPAVLVKDEIVAPNVNQKTDTASSVNAVVENTLVLLEVGALASRLVGKVRNGIVKEGLTCRLCQSKFTSLRRVVKHMMNHGLTGQALQDSVSSGSEEQEACNVCGYRTKNHRYHYMHYHKYFKHGVPLPLGWKASRCEICGKECFTKFQLKEHTKSHNGPTSHICSICGQEFTTRNSLNGHVFHKHNEERKHRCKVCEKAFKTWTQLKIHVRTHSGDRPFSCVDCPHKSTTQWNMKLHLATVHGHSKEKVKELILKIANDAPDLTPESLEQLMNSLPKEAVLQEKTSPQKRTKKSAKAQLESPHKPEDAKLGRPKKLGRQMKPSPPSFTSGEIKGTELKKMKADQRGTAMKHLESLLSQPTATTMVDSEHRTSKAGFVSKEVDQSRNVSALSGLLHHQLQQQSAGPPATTLFIPLSVPATTSLLGYTAIPTFSLTGPSSLGEGPMSVTSILTMNDVASSGMCLMSQSYAQDKTVAQTLGPDVLTAEDSFLANFNFPVTEYTVKCSGSECADTIKLEVDLENPAATTSVL